MTSKELTTRIKQKRDTSANWTANNPVLLNGEIILVDTAEGELRAKIGDGTKTYTQLPFSDEALRSLITEKTVVDSALSSTSTNPVQNKVVNTAISNLNTLVGDTSVASQISTAIANKVDKVDGKGLSTNDYTTAEKNKLAGIAEGAEVNQNAFSNVVVGSTTIAADSKTDSLTLVAGSNVTITPDATNDKVTIAATDTVYTHPSYTARTGVPTANATPAFGGTFNVSQPVSDATGHITAINSRTVTIPNTAATTSAAGLMSAADKTKLDGIATGADKTTVDSALSSTSTNPVQNKVVNTAITNLNTLVGDTAVSEQISSATNDCIISMSVSGQTITYTKKSGSTGTITTQDTNTTYSNMKGATSSTAGTAGLVPAPAAGKQTSFLRGDGTWVVPTDTTYSNMTGATTSAAGTSGLVPAPSAGAATRYLRSDGTWAVPPDTDTTYSNATTSAAGLMSASDKSKLDGIATGATKVTVDSALSTTSTNPVQNQIVTASINNLNTLVGDTSVSSQISTAIANKVDKVDGKDLSTNDYTDAEKEKLSNVGEWAKIYDSGEITTEVNSISSIDVANYKNLMVAVKCVNTTSSAGTRSGAVIFTGSNGQDYAFNNIFSNLIKNGTTTSGAMAKFKIVEGFIICESAMRAITADGILSDTEGEGFDLLAPVSSGLIKCTSTVATMAVSSAAQSADHYYGVGSRVIVWGCKV